MDAAVASNISEILAGIVSVIASRFFSEPPERAQNILDKVIGRFPEGIFR